MGSTARSGAAEQGHSWLFYCATPSARPSAPAAARLCNRPTEAKVCGGLLLPSQTGLNVSTFAGMCSSRSGNDAFNAMHFNTIRFQEALCLCMGDRARHVALLVYSKADPAKRNAWFGSAYFCCMWFSHMKGIPCPMYKQNVTLQPDTATSCDDNLPDRRIRF